MREHACRTREMACESVPTAGGKIMKDRGTIRANAILANKKLENTKLANTKQKKRGRTGEIKLHR